MHRHLYVLDKRLQPTAMLYLVGLLSGAQVEYKPVDLQSYEARNGASLAQSFKGIRKAKMHFDRISDSLKNTFSVAVDLQNEFYIINACIIYHFLL